MGKKKNKIFGKDFNIWDLSAVIIFTLSFSYWALNIGDVSLILPEVASKIWWLVFAYFLGRVFILAKK